LPWRGLGAIAQAYAASIMPGRWRGFVPVLLQNYAARRELRRCASLDPRFARDIGLTPDELAMVCAAPPWRRTPSGQSIKKGEEPGKGATQLGRGEGGSASVILTRWPAEI